MNLRLNILGFTIASLTLEFDGAVTVEPGYPPVVDPTGPVRRLVRKGIKKISTEWVGEMSA